MPPQVFCNLTWPSQPLLISAQESNLSRLLHCNYTSPVARDQYAYVHVVHAPAAVAFHDRPKAQILRGAAQPVSDVVVFGFERKHVHVLYEPDAVDVYVEFGFVIARGFIPEDVIGDGRSYVRNRLAPGGKLRYMGCIFLSGAPAG